MGWQLWDRDDAFLNQIRDAGLASEDGELWRAVWDKDFKRIQVLLDEGANPNAVATINCQVQRTALRAKENLAEGIVPAARLFVPCYTGRKAGGTKV